MTVYEDELEGEGLVSAHWIHRSDVDSSSPEAPSPTNRPGPRDSAVAAGSLFSGVVRFYISSKFYPIDLLSTS